MKKRSEDAPKGIIRSVPGKKRFIFPKRQDLSVIASLLSDYDTVGYLSFKNDTKDDLYTEYYISDAFLRHFPGWNDNSSYASKLHFLWTLISDNKEREDFINATRRGTILKELETQNAYYADFRFSDEKDSPQYRLRFFADRNSRGKLIGFTFGMWYINNVIKELGLTVGSDSRIPLEDVASLSRRYADELTRIQNANGDKSESAHVFEGTSILLADDNGFSRELNKDILQDEGAVVSIACDGKEVLKKFSETKYDMILMDIVMPEMDGIEATKEIRARESGSDNRIPIIALTADANDEICSKILIAGADSCVSKPLSISEVSKIYITSIKARYSRAEMKLENTLRAANTDPLTHVKNLAAYTERIRLLAQNIANDSSFGFAVVFCDINALKYHNDTYGHEAGDIYIKNGCGLICRIFAHSPVFRVGGDEFAVLVQGSDFENIHKLISQLRSDVEAAEKIDTPFNGKTSLSAGLAIYDPQNDKNVTDTVKRADANMYTEKAKWRATHVTEAQAAAKAHNSAL